MLEIIPKNTKFDFAGKIYFFLGLSTLLILGSITLLFVKGPNYGIDFTGGAEVQLQFKTPTNIGDLRGTLESGGFKNLTIQQLGESNANEFLVKLRGDDENLQKISEKTENILTQKFQKQDFEIQRVDVVGPQAGSELRKSGFLSMFYALLCILIYVAIRFDMRYSPGAVLALFHDSMITMGILILMEREFNLQIIAAILAIIGYSNNDTIIVFDRIRESIQLYPNNSIEANVNRSINETLSRTLLTSLTTLLVVIALMVLGGGVIKDFAITMFIGILVGTYSSIFIASPILILLTRLKERRNKKQVNTNTQGTPELSLDGKATKRTVPVKSM